MIETELREWRQLEMMEGDREKEVNWNHWEEKGEGGRNGKGEGKEEGGVEGDGKGEGGRNRGWERMG